MDFNIIRMMASIFTPDLLIGNTASLINFFQNNTEDRFDGELTSLPLPKDAPLEIPRLIMNSNDGAWKLEVSGERTNIIFNKPLNLSIEEPSLDVFSSYALNIFKSYQTIKDLRVQRLALNTERIFNTEGKEPSQFIADKFCRDEYLTKPFNKTKGFEIHSLKKYQHQDFDLNSWVRVKSANLQNDSKTPVVLVKNDLNTYSFLESPNTSFNIDDLERFFSAMPDHLEDIVGLYFDPRS